MRRTALTVAGALGCVLVVAFGLLYGIAGIGACDAQGFPRGCESDHWHTGELIAGVGLALLVGWTVLRIASRRGRSSHRP